MQSVNLSDYDNQWYKPGRSMVWRSLWHFAGIALLRCPLITSSGFRSFLLRSFGARIGAGVVMRHPFKVKYPWHLSIGANSWIGEDCWIDNLVEVTIGSNVCVSQGAYLCTGNHDWTDPSFGLVVAPIRLEEGCWAGAMCVVAPGTTLCCESIVTAGSVVSGIVRERSVYTGNPAVYVKDRVFKFKEELLDNGRASL